MNLPKVSKEHLEPLPLRLELMRVDWVVFVDLRLVVQFRCHFDSVGEILFHSRLWVIGNNPCLLDSLACFGELYLLSCYFDILKFLERLCCLLLIVELHPSHSFPVLSSTRFIQNEVLEPFMLRYDIIQIIAIDFLGHIGYIDSG